MAGTPRIRTYAIAVVGLASLLIAACGSSAEATEPQPTAIEPTATTQVIQVTPVPTATAAADPQTAVKVIEERTEDEQAVLEIWNAQVANVLAQQYDGFSVGCPPEFTKSAEEYETAFEQFLTINEISVSELRFGEPAIRVMSGGIAIAEYQFFVVNEPKPIRADFYTKNEDGTWYRDC